MPRCVIYSIPGYFTGERGELGVWYGHLHLSSYSLLSQLLILNNFTLVPIEWLPGILPGMSTVLNMTW